MTAPNEIPSAAPGRRRLWATCSLILLGGLTLIAIRWGPGARGNFGVVEPGLVVRSAQPVDERILRKLVRENRISSILNLRGGSMADSWYDAEVRVAREAGVAFYDFPISATRRPSRRQLLILLDLFEHCRYPLLIHCKSGADRTGLASALYKMARGGEPPERAIAAFSLRYGHVPLLGPEHLHEPFLEYASWLKDRQLDHTPARLRAWVEHEYRAGDPLRALPHLPPGPRLLYEGKSER